MDCHEGEQDEEVEQEVANVSESGHDHLHKEAETFEEPQVKVDLHGEEEDDCALQAGDAVVRGQEKEACHEIGDVYEDESQVDEVPKVCCHVCERTVLQELFRFMDHLVKQEDYREDPKSNGPRRIGLKVWSLPIDNVDNEPQEEHEGKC